MLLLVEFAHEGDCGRGLEVVSLMPSSLLSTTQAGSIRRQCLVAHRVHLGDVQRIVR